MPIRSGRALRVASAIALASALSSPAIARASDMSGLVVIVVGLFVGIPAAVLLVVSIVVSIAARARKTSAAWHRPYATSTTVVAPLLGLAYPASMLLLGGSRTKSDFVVLALVFDLPVLALAIVAVVLARGLARAR